MNERTFHPHDWHLPLAEWYRRLDAADPQTPEVVAFRAWLAKQEKVGLQEFGVTTAFALMGGEPPTIQQIAAESLKIQSSPSRLLSLKAFDAEALDNAEWDRVVRWVDGRYAEIEHIPTNAELRKWLASLMHMVDERDWQARHNERVAKKAIAGLPDPEAEELTKELARTYYTP